MKENEVESDSSSNQSLLDKKETLYKNFTKRNLDLRAVTTLYRSKNSSTNFQTSLDKILLKRLHKEETK